MQLLAARERELELGAALLVEIELERNDRHALALDARGEPVDLPAMQQQFARPLRRVIEAAGLQVFGDVGVDEPHLAFARIGIGFADGRLALAQRLHLGAGQRDAGLERLADLIVEARLAVVGDDLDLALWCFAMATTRQLSSGDRGFR